MNITIIDALLINSILFIIGFSITIYIYQKFKDKFSGLVYFCNYFLMNSIGIFLLSLFDDNLYFLTIVLANLFLVVGSLFLIAGMLKFYKRKVPYRFFGVVTLLALIILIYFTFVDYNYYLRSMILGIIVLIIHLFVLYIIYDQKNKENRGKFRIELLSMMITIYILSIVLIGVLPLFNEIPESLFDMTGFVVSTYILIGVSGAFISIGLFSMINNILLVESKESANAFHNVILKSPLPLLIHTEDGEILFVSDVFTEITGYTLDDVSTIDKWIHLAYDLERDYIKKIIKGLYVKPYKTNDNTSKVITKDKKTRIWSFHSSYVGKYVDGRSMAMSVATDITETQKKDIELKKLETKNVVLTEANKKAIELAGLLVWSKNYEKNKENNDMYVNERYAEVMGYTVSENGTVSDQSFYDSIYHDNSGLYKEFFTKQKMVHNNQIDEYSLVNFRHINAVTKKDVYLNHHTKVEERFSDGTVKRIGGYVVDVTESIKDELKLKFEREKSQKYLDIIGTMVLILDKKGRITLLNKKGCQLLGVKEEEVLGKNWFDEFVPKEIKDEVKKMFNSVFDNDLEFASQYENIVITRTGEKRVVNWHNSILLDIDKKISGIISSGEDVTEKRLYEDNLKEIGYRDALTGLHNRRYYEEELKRIDIEINYPITIAMGDINGLKLINDAFGHESGDELLISAANVIKSTCRETDLIARIGGDEFVIVMPNTSAVEADKVIRNIHKKSKNIRIESIELSISFGIQTKNSKEQDIQEIYRSAEDLMYREKLLEIPSMRSGAIETILNTLYEKDEKSEIHSRTVSLISEKIAKASGMSRQDIAETKTAGLLHDIGKIIISLSIINKDGKLTTSEYNAMKNHPEIGFRILNSTSDMRSISNIVLCHHERWDGSGYPRGIKAEDIPIKARIIAIADSYDAMTSERTYRNIFTKEEALEEIIANAGSQFDPKLVKVFKENFKKIVKDL